MQDIHTLLSSLKRPNLLVRAARIGAQEYKRGRQLRRALGTVQSTRPAQAIMRLLEIEREQDDLRRSGSALYSATRHVDVLVALMGEARLLKSAPRPTLLRSAG